MANEWSVRAGIQLGRNAQTYRTTPGAYNANFNGSVGPVPGSFIVPTYGIDVDLSKITTLGGLCEISNIDNTAVAGTPQVGNPVHYGIRDTSTGKVYMTFMIWPGETHIVRLSTFLFNEISGTSSGTTGSGVVLHMIAPDGAATVKVMAFDA